MVKVDDKLRNITIIMNGDESTVHEAKKALIDLIQHYNYDEFGDSASETMFYGMELLKALQ